MVWVRNDGVKAGPSRFGKGLLIVLVLGGLVAACAPNGALPAAPAAATATAGGVSPISPPERQTALRTDDIIQVNVFDETNLTTQAAVDPQGMVTLPLLNQVKVGGLVPDQAARVIQKAYGKDVLVNPQVSVLVVSRAKRRFTVLGEVNRPGVYEFPPDEGLNILQAIAMGGGATRVGSLSDVTVQRWEDGQQKTYHPNVRAMTLHRNEVPFAVEPNDVITVGEKML